MQYKLIYKDRRYGGELYTHLRRGHKKEGNEGTFMTDGVLSQTGSSSTKDLWRLITSPGLGIWREIQLSVETI